ncbi:uncharacterized protein LOC120339411 [Styela clava]
MSEVMPEAKYTKFGEKIRHVIPGPMQCSMACGGRNCKWENPSRWSDEDQVIKGVFSSWVLDEVVAMSRPSTEVIKKYDLIKQFKESDISSIINLQRPGEHASCGPPLHKESQFTYDPQIFMENDIFFYNFGWKDYGVTSLETILDMVKVMAFALTEGKVAVHCHAGLGRTGVLIACYLVYAHRMDASFAINTVRKRRPNSIQTRGQIACIQEFAQFLKPLRIVFPQVVPHAERLNLTQFLHRQRHLLHGFESRELRYTPKIVSLVCQRLIEIATTSDDTSLYDMRTRSNTGPRPRGGKKSRKLRRSNTIETLKETLPGAFVNEHLDGNEMNLNPGDSQKMNALLSPRFSRRNDSAKSKSSSVDSKSHSRPESPVTCDIDAIKPEQNFNSNNKSNAPILVATVSAPQFLPSTTSNDHSGDNNNKVPGEPQVVLVKQGSRTGLLSTATNVAQPQSTDANINNNNQIVTPSVTLQKQPPLFTLRSNSEDTVQVVEKELPKEITCSQDDDVIPTKTNLPSPTLSIHEPQISPRGKPPTLPNKDVQIAAGDKVTIQNVRTPAGQSQRILPTGMPSIGRVGSGKGKMLSFFAEEKADKLEGGINDDAKSEQNNEENQVNGNNEEDKPDDNNVDITDESIVEDKQEVFDEELLDQELEIVEMKDDDGHFLSESESEKEDSKPDKFLSQSTSSKISWTEQIGKNAGDECNIDTKNDSLLNNSNEELCSRSTPLMSRVDHSKEFLADERATDKEETSMKKDQDDSEDPKLTDAVDIKSNDNDGIGDLTLPLPKSSPTSKKRPKSASFLKRMSAKQNGAQKQPPLRNLTLTQSLCDLRNYEKIAHDDLFLMTAEMTNDIFLSLSPGSKSSSSDDVRTPTGSASKRRIKDPITVAMALAYKLTDNEWLWEKVYTKQVELNTREGAWSGVEQEVDAHLLACLMWSWIEHLSEPVLTLPNIEYLIKESRPSHNKISSATECPDPILFEKALKSLGKSISSTMQCVISCLLSLPPLSYELEASVIRRVTSALTQFYIDDDTENPEILEQSKKQEQLVSLFQNYLVKMRARSARKQSIIDEKNSKENEISNLNKKEKRNENNNNAVDEKKTENFDDSKKGFSKAEGDNTSSTSKVSELPLRIAVS